MIRLTCPECHSRCRLKSDETSHNFSYGRCPACGHRFPLPPADEQHNIVPTGSEKSGADNRNQWGKIRKAVVKAKITELIRNPLFISACGLIMALLLLTISLTSNREVTVTSTTKKTSLKTTISKSQAVPSPTLQTVKLKPVKLKLDLETGARAIAQIKHHALVADADINIHDQQLQLSLLVSDKTPVSYSERLGCQFVHYVKELIPKEQHPSFLVSVYYPDGTRIEVTINDQFPEEEIIQQMNNED
jgi:hypothetical protein